MNYFPFHLGDYAAHTAHLEPMEDLAYRRMLDLYYLRESALPADAAQVARLIRMRSNVADVEAVLNEFFVLGADGWRQERCDQEIAHMQDKQAKAKASAEASVNARKANAKVKPATVLTDAQRTLNERSAGVELPTPTPTPTPVNSVTDVTGDKPPLTPDEIIFGYGVPILTNAGTAEKQARSFLGGLRKAHGDDAVVNTLRECIRAKPLQPLEWLAKAMLPDATGVPAETRYQRSKREQMERDFPNLMNKPEFSNGLAALVD